MKQLATVLPAACTELIERLGAQLGQRRGNSRQQGWAVALMGVEGRRHIRTVGLEHDLLGGQGRDGLAQAVCLRPGSGASQPQLEAELAVFAGLFRAAAEGVNDAASGRAIALERGDDVSVGLADMQQAGQLAVDRQLQLGLE